tara:strand:- start:6219 stop:6521 length:303 start_codon:yes stop_codon:yes gene_type:complete
MAVPKIVFKQWTCDLHVNKDKNGRLGVWLTDSVNGDNIATCSVDLTRVPPKEGTFYVKDYSENEGMTKALLKSKVVEVIQELTINEYGSKVTLVKLLVEL